VTSITNQAVITEIITTYSKQRLRHAPRSRSLPLVREEDVSGVAQADVRVRQNEFA
jgi:hypothetical protein